MVLAALLWPAGNASSDLIDTSTKLNPKPSTVAELNFEPARIGREERFMQSLSRSWAGPELFIRQIILDESWEEWIAYQRSLHTYIPIHSLKRIIRTNRRLPGMISYDSSQYYPNERGKVDPGKSLSELGRYFFIYTQRSPMEQAGPISFDGKEMSTEGKGWNWISFLMEKDGILSGEEWNMDNFLPRLATVALLLTLGFVVTEGARYIIRLGKRSLKKK